MRRCIYFLTFLCFLGQVESKDQRQRDRRCLSKKPTYAPVQARSPESLWYFDPENSVCLEFLSLRTEDRDILFPTQTECEEACLLTLSRPPRDAAVPSCTEIRDAEMKRSETGIVGNFIPDCTDSGKYKPLQCHGSTGYCWCSNEETGEKLTGTEVGPGRGRPNC